MVGPSNGSRVYQKRRVTWDSNKGGFKSFKWVTQGEKPIVGLGSNRDPRGPEKPMLDLGPNGDTCMGFPNIPELTNPIRFEVGESSSLADLRPPTHKAHDSMMVASSKTQHDGSAAQNEMLGRPAKPTTEVDSRVSTEFHAEESPMIPGKADTVRIHSSMAVTSSACARENSVPQIDAMGRPEKALMEVECPFSDGSRAIESPKALGNAEIESGKASIGLFLSNFFLSLSRVGIVDLGAQDGAEGGWVGCAAQGIDTSHQANTLAVSVD